MNDPIFCALAFGSVNITASNRYIPCCNTIHDSVNPVPMSAMGVGQSPATRLNISSVVEVRKSLAEGVWHKSCGLCQNAEKVGAQSMRIIWNDALQQYTIPVTAEADPKDIRFMSLAFGTKCNSKCMTCSPSSSDFWYDEYMHIWRDDAKEKVKARKVIPIIVTNDNTIEILETFPNVEHITLLGGEPTIVEEHNTLLQTLIASGKSKNISLTYVTNLTGISDELIEQWQSFKHISIMVSIDGIGLSDEYIRYPFKWSKVETNLRKVLELHRSKQASVGLSCTASMFNCLDIADLLLYWYELCEEYDNLSNGLYINKVTTPAYTGCNIMSDEHRQEAIERLKEVKAIFDADSNLNLSYTNSASLLIDWLDKPRASNELIENAKHFILESDKFRNRHIKNYIPKVWEDLFT